MVSLHSKPCLHLPVKSGSWVERRYLVTPAVHSLLELFETLDTLITGGRICGTVPGALETGRKHPFWGRPDIPGHRQVHLLVPLPTFLSSRLLTAYFLQGPSR